MMNSNYFLMHDALQFTLNRNMKFARHSSTAMLCLGWFVSPLRLFNLKELFGSRLATLRFPFRHNKITSVSVIHPAPVITKNAEAQNPVFGHCMKLLMNSYFETADKYYSRSKSGATQQTKWRSTGKYFTSPVFCAFVAK